MVSEFNPINEDLRSAPVNAECPDPDFFKGEPANVPTLKVDNFLPTQNVVLGLKSQKSGEASPRIYTTAATTRGNAATTDLKSGAVSPNRATSSNKCKNSVVGPYSANRARMTKSGSSSKLAGPNGLSAAHPAYMPQLKSPLSPASGNKATL